MQYKFNCISWNVDLLVLLSLCLLIWTQVEALGVLPLFSSTKLSFSCSFFLMLQCLCCSSSKIEKFKCRGEGVPGGGGGGGGGGMLRLQIDRRINE